MNLADIKISSKRLRGMKPEVVAMLAESMQARGLLQPIVVTDAGMLVAGLNRVEAARKLGWREIAHRTIGKLSRDDMMLAEIDENLIRGELSPAERAIHTTERKRLYEKQHRGTKHGGAPGRAGGGKKAKDAKLASFADDTAKKTQRSKRDIARDATRADHIPQIADVVGTSLDQGDELDALTKLPADEQAAIIARAAKGEKVSAKPAAKRAKRAEREQSSGQAQANENAKRTLNDRQFGVIYLDPPWRFETFSEAGKDRSADNHYGTLSIAEIRERKPPVAKDCVVFMWTTGPMLGEAIQLLKDWGFTYKARFVWRKPTAGTGFWQRDNGEELLVATVGKVVAPAPGTQALAVIDAPTEQHSRKPGVFAAMIERLFPNTPKLEMYARPPFRGGWSVWGNEVPDGMMEVPVAARAA